MSAIVAIVGRPNVGKSTLFNRLTKSRQALVDDLPGVTRDRLYGKVETTQGSFTLVDTGGFDPPADQAFADEVHYQIKLALAEADLVVFLADGRQGLSPLDQEIARQLRRTEKPTILAVNKVDGPQQENEAQEFHALALEPIHFISAAHGYGVADFLDDICGRLPLRDEAEEDDSLGVRVTLLGRPNVGKSSLLNALAGRDRVAVSDTAGTTRDAVDTPISHQGRNYLLIDTAGIRRQGKVERGLEKAAVFRSLRTLERAHVALVLMDAGEGVTDQDLRLAGQAVEAGRCLIVALNKWDLLTGDTEKQKRVLDQLEFGLKFAPWAPVLKISALKGKGLKGVFPAVDRVYRDYNLRISTGQLNKALEYIVEKHQPPMVKGKRLKFYYASQAGVRPPTVVLFVSNPAGVHFSYRRYLLNELRGVLGIQSGPLRLVFKERPGRKPAHKKKRSAKRSKA